MADKLAYHVNDFIENGRDFVVARVIDTLGSAPRKSGAIMILTDKGDFLGTVGGGKVEAVAQEECVNMFREKGPSKVFHYKLKTKGEDALGMGCGGEADILVEYVHADDPGDIMRLFDNPCTAFIFGAGHVALALEPILRHINFNTVVIDPRSEYANKDRFPKAKIVVPENFTKSFDDLEFDKDSYIVIVTRGHMGDLDVLREAIKQDCAYVGMIGSRGKDLLLYKQLKKEGVSQEDIDKVYAPIGEEIYAETPEEIGVSIAAEMIKVRAGHGSK
ncbi:MAG: XdhC family protein [Anaerovoracaceae bacterium]|jgi:xanthine dehydrogenase accessory factor